MKLVHTVSFISLSSFSVTKASLSNQSFLDNIKGYGCWCHLDDTENDLAMAGPGTPVDPVDLECMNLVLNYRNMLQFNVCPDTKPWDVDYIRVGGRSYFCPTLRHF